MKRKLASLLLASTVAFLATGAYAAPTQAAAQGLTREQVRAQFNRAFLNGTTAEDEKMSYSSPPSDQAELVALRKKDARVDPAP